MADSTEPAVTVGEVGALLADLRTISGRLARFEPVTRHELTAFEARKRVLLGRIEAAEPWPISGPGEEDLPRCACGHYRYEHDDAVHDSGDSAGECRQCECEAFTVNEERLL